MFESNIFVFKENLKILMAHTVDHIWQNEIRNADIDTMVIKELNKGDCAEIVEVDEDGYYSNVISKPSMDKMSPLANKLKSFTEISGSEISNTRSMASHIDLDSHYAATEKNGSEGNSNKKIAVNRWKENTMQKLKESIDKKFGFGSRLKDNRKNIESNIQRRGSLKAKPISSIVTHTPPPKKHSLLSFNTDLKAKDCAETGLYYHKKDKTSVTDHQKNIKLNSSTNKISKVTLYKKPFGMEEVKTTQKTEVPLQPLKIDKGVKETPTERRVPKFHEIVRKVSQNVSQNGSKRDFNED